MGLFFISHGHDCLAYTRLQEDGHCHADDCPERFAVQEDGTCAECGPFTIVEDSGRCGIP